MWKSLPNLLTISRIIIIPIVVAAFYIEGKMAHWVAASLFAYASVTDYVDGYLARLWHQESSLGRFLDPIADKLLIAAALLMLVKTGRADVIPAILIVCREILVSGLREFLAELRISVPVSRLAKIKTAVQMLALFLLLLGSRGSGYDWMDGFANGVLWIAAALTIVTGYAYLKAGAKHMY
ncbi:MAG: CDP-diacylglycerol--glycerol-3-phosphate 3-phosphatidyltransferase [Proteobacteria bacterium]|nr:CDP-diacylglycerol--glycerol-3-phosphate 3-phosphatidyltransferase [Pseudomonadota bacterium]